jgi:ELWxxDGT repeat protein
MGETVGVRRGSGRAVVLVAALVVLLSTSMMGRAAAQPLLVVPVSHINPGQVGSFPFDLADFGGTLFFTAFDDDHGAELWKTDGTKAGTVLVKDINPGPGSSGPSYPTEVGGMLFFSADDGIHGRELWKTDGTEAGTVLVKDINPGTFFSIQGGLSVSPLSEVGGILLFAARDGGHGQELWRSDGTEAGTVLVKDIIPGMGSSIFVDPSLTDVEGTLFFIANDGIHGTELWKSDGTEAGTVLVKDINPGTGHSRTGDGRESGLIDIGGTLFFNANDGVHGNELWKSDGTEAGTVLVKDINLGTGDSWPGAGKEFGMTDLGGIAFFNADDGVHRTELWKSDGTEAGTVLVKDINPGTGSSSPFFLTGVGETLFFLANDGVHGGELWKSDGTEAGTVLVKDINPGTEHSNARFFADFEGTVFFSADDGARGHELWKSDGTEDGTVLVKDIGPGREGSVPLSLTVIGETLFFTADGGFGRELWKAFQPGP